MDQLFTRFPGKDGLYISATSLRPVLKASTSTINNALVRYGKDKEDLKHRFIVNGQIRIFLSADKLDDFLNYSRDRFGNKHVDEGLKILHDALSKEQNTNPSNPDSTTKFGGSLSPEKQNAIIEAMQNNIDRCNDMIKAEQERSEQLQKDIDALMEQHNADILATGKAKKELMLATAELDNAKKHLREALTKNQALQNMVTKLRSDVSQREKWLNSMARSSNVSLQRIGRNTMKELKKDTSALSKKVAEALGKYKNGIMSG